MFRYVLQAYNYVDLGVLKKQFRSLKKIDLEVYEICDLGVLKVWLGSPQDLMTQVSIEADLEVLVFPNSEACKG